MMCRTFDVQNKLPNSISSYFYTGLGVVRGQMLCTLALQRVPVDSRHRLPKASKYASMGTTFPCTCLN